MSVTAPTAPAAPAPRRNARPRPSLPTILLWVLVTIILLYLVFPVFVVVPVSFSSAKYLQFPPPGWSLQWYQNYLDRPGWVPATFLSIRVAIVVAILATVLGTAASLALVRGRFPGKSAVNSFMVSPLVVPAIIVAIGIYFFYAQVKLVGNQLGLILAHTTLAFPFVVTNVSATLQGFDERLEYAAMNLGANRWQTFWRVTLPIIKPGVFAGALFAFIITSNTSGLRITDISRMAAKAERMATTHFWFPAHLVPLVEVVMGERTREQTARWLHGVLLGWGKVPVIVRRDLPGQLANRIQQALIREAICLVQDGVASPEDVDMAIKMSMGIRLPVWGPLEHIDAVGLDLALSVQKDVLSSLDHSPQPPELLAQKVREGNLGHRTGKGFYDWNRKSMPELLPRRDRFIMQALRIIREERGD